jgi:hypothetical protein
MNESRMNPTFLESAFFIDTTVLSISDENSLLMGADLIRCDYVLIS